MGEEGGHWKETAGPDVEALEYNTKEFELCHSQVLHLEWMGTLPPLLFPAGWLRGSLTFKTVSQIS